MRAVWVWGSLDSAGRDVAYSRPIVFEDPTAEAIYLSHWFRHRITGAGELFRT